MLRNRNSPTAVENMPVDFGGSAPPVAHPKARFNFDKPPRRLPSHLRTTHNSRMKSRLLTFVLAAPCLTFAAGSATEILQHVAAVYRDLRSYEVRVTAQTVRGSDVSERHFAETGSGPGKYRVEFDNPSSELRVGDGQDEWLFRPDTNEYSKTPLAAAGTHIGALAEIDRHVREASIAREEEFLVNGKPVPIYVVNVVRDQWPRGSIEGAEHTMYRIDRESFVVYEAITY